MSFLYLLLFIFCLSVLIVIHELGHFLTAKAFKVYCFEFSVGMGPKLFSIKRKNQETAFTLRAIPFGGYVSMYGEADQEQIENDERLKGVDPSRSLNNIKRWKRAIIMAAGVIMNMLLAIVIFFVCEFALPQHDYSARQLTVKENSYAYNLYHDDGLDSGDIIYINTEKVFADAYIIDNNALISYNDGVNENVYAVIKNQITNSKKLGYENFLAFVKEDYVLLDDAKIVEKFASLPVSDSIYSHTIYGFSAKVELLNWNNATNKGNITFVLSNNTKIYIENYENKTIFDSLFLTAETYVYGNLNNSGTKYNLSSNSAIDLVKEDTKKSDTIYTVIDNELPGLEKINFNLTIIDNPEASEESGKKYNFELKNKYNSETLTHYYVLGDDSSFDNIGLSITHSTYHNSFGKALGNTFKDVGESSIAIFKGLGAMFTNIDQVGGIISIGFETTSILKNFGFSSFLRIWGLISVNLAIMNILPFPGLDGWHLLVLIVEGVFKKEIPSKLKGIMSIIGIALLFALMILLLFKDIFKYII